MGGLPLAAAGPTVVPAPGLSHAFAALVLTLLMGLQPLTTDPMLPALPALAADLHASMAPVQLTMAALILGFGLAQLVWGPVADRVGPIWGFDDEAQELSNMWTRTGQPGLWFIAGSFAQCRIYSKVLALQIKAVQQGLLTLSPSPGRSR